MGMHKIGRNVRHNLTCIERVLRTVYLTRPYPTHFHTLDLMDIITLGSV